MDFTPIIAKLWGALGWFIPLMLQNGTLMSSWAKGEADELLVRLFAHWQLDTQTYRHLHNVILSTPDSTAQIDHVLLSHYGTEGIGFTCCIKSFQSMAFRVAEVDAPMPAMQAGWRSLLLVTHREHVPNLKRPGNPAAGRERPKFGSVLVPWNVKTG